MAIQNPVTNMGVDASGNSEAQLMTSGASKVSLPSDSYGTLSVGELSGTDTEASTIYSFPNGLSGVSVTNNCPAVYNTAEADGVMVYIGFNNTAFNDAAVPGLRYMVGPGDTISLAFTNTPLPSKMTLRVDATQVTAFFSAVEA
jgi:hypothetical protein